MNWSYGEVHPIYGKVEATGWVGSVPYRWLRTPQGMLNTISLETLNNYKNTLHALDNMDGEHLYLFLKTLSADARGRIEACLYAIDQEFAMANESVSA